MFADTLSQLNCCILSGQSGRLKKVVLESRAAHIDSHTHTVQANKRFGIAVFFDRLTSMVWGERGMAGGCSLNKPKRYTTFGGYSQWEADETF